MNNGIKSKYLLLLFTAVKTQLNFHLYNIYINKKLLKKS